MTRRGRLPLRTVVVVAAAAAGLSIVSARSTTHRYRIEASNELPPTACRFVRLTLTGWPRNAGTPLGVVEFTVFGNAVRPSVPKARGDAK